MPELSPAIDDLEVSLVLTALRERWGYDFTGYAPASVRRRLVQICAAQGVERAGELLAPILYDPQAASQIINGMSVAASEFFRDPAVWRFVRDEVCPPLHGFPHITVWQAGCGRGEETYTLAILLEEAGLAARTRLIASDVNPQLLAAARCGRYGARNLPGWQQNYRTAGGVGDFVAYFADGGEALEVLPRLRERVEFVEHNLVGDEVFVEAQMIVCRNVLIYFGEALQRRALDLFRRSLQRGGYLLLGQSESLLEVQGRLGPFRRLHDAYRAYQKPVRSARRCR